MTSAIDTEALRQQALLAALLTRELGSLALREDAGRAERGLAAYRANAYALAERALAAAFPTVQAMLGETDFAQLARLHWREHPPQQGDIGAWGEALPAAIEAHANLTDLPWLADCARLDFALHRCERAADDTLDAGSLARLSEADPARLQLVTMPGLALIVSAYPIGTIHAAHQRRDGDAFAPVRAALATGRGEAVCVARRGFRAVVHAVDAPTAAWLHALLAGASLAAALERAGPGFDFAAWLALALRAHWLKCVKDSGPGLD
jgi:hypothetical protein